MATRSTPAADQPAPLPVSVVIPAYNRPEMTAKAVRSALDQRPRPPAEVLVVDDCSTDDTAERAAAAGATVLHHERNSGESVARNTGIEAATQPWVAFLDSDDEWRPQHLACMWPYTDRCVLVSTSAWASRDRADDGLLWGVASTTWLESPADVASPANMVVASSTLVRREGIRASGGFPPGMAMCADLDAWLRLLEHGRGVVLPDIGVQYQLHAQQVSANRAAMRAAHRDVLRSYADRPWYSAATARELEGAQAWDELREAVSARSPLASLRAARRALGGTSRIRGVVQLLRHRYRNRLATEALKRAAPST